MPHAAPVSDVRIGILLALKTRSSISDRLRARNPSCPADSLIATAKLAHEEKREFGTGGSSGSGAVVCCVIKNHPQHEHGCDWHGCVDQPRSVSGKKPSKKAAKKASKSERRSA